VSPTTRQWLGLPEKVPFPPRVDWWETVTDDSKLDNSFDIDYYDDGWPAEEVVLEGRVAFNPLRPFRGLLIPLRA